MTSQDFSSLEFNTNTSMYNYMLTLFFFLMMNTISQVVSVYTSNLSDLIIFSSFFIVVILAFIDERLSAIGFITLSLSSLSPVMLINSSYLIQDFGVQRLFNVSMPTLCATILVLIKFTKNILCENRKEISIDSFRILLFITILVCYSMIRQFLLGGVVFYAFIEEFNFLVFFLFSYVVVNDLKFINVPVVLIVLIFSSILKSIFYSHLGIHSFYGGQQGYIFDFCFDLIPILPLIIYEVLKRRLYLLVSLFFVFIIYFGGGYIIGGKNLFVFGLSLFFSLFVISKRVDNRILYVFCFFILFAVFFMVYNIDYIISLFEILEIDSLNYKLFQIKQGIMYGLDFSYLDTSLSVGNILAEIYTVFHANTYNVFDFLFGKGVGGVYRDLNGLLSSSNDAYPDSMFLRNEFYRFHIPLAIILSWSGMLGLLWYFVSLKKIIKMFNSSPGMVGSLLCLVLFFMGSYKEYFVLIPLVYVYAKERFCEKIVCC